MTEPTTHIRPGHNSITPYLIVKGAVDAIEFYKKALGAKEITRLAEPGGKIMNAEIAVENSMIMIADEFPAWGSRSPQSFGGSPVTIHLYVKDVDATIKNAIGAGAKIVSPVKDQFHGDRSGTITDPFGHTWTIATHKEHVPFQEIQKRAAALFSAH